jgi:hypothetical protein
MSAPAEWVSHREMGITHEELLRLLPQVVPASRWQRAPGRITVEDRGRRLEIRYAPQVQRRIGALLMPVTRIELRLLGFTGTQRRALLRRFEQAFLKGGG